MSVPDAWLLDITESRDGRSVVLWTKARGSGRVRRTAVDYRPPFYVVGARPELDDLVRFLGDRPSVDRLRPVVLRPSIFDRRPRRVLEVVPTRHTDRRALANAIDARGGFVRFQLFDVDLGAPQLYHLAHDLYPFAPIVGTAADLAATEPAETIDYEFPPLRVARLAVSLAGSRRGRLPPPDGRVAAIRLGAATLEGPEEDLLRALVAELARTDPDVLLTEGGDAVDLPWLYRRAAAVGLGPAEFVLGREPAPFGPARSARSFATYGQVVHRAATYPLVGRFHLDRENSFLFDDADLSGLVDAARLSRLSLSTVARQSPGTCFTAMEMAEALRRGAHVPWKKNRPEAFRRADRLVAADRGGVIFVPPVGLFGPVDEFDFASLFPHLMVRKNLSAETLECRCCPESPLRAPGLGYRSCTREVGLIPRTLEPLLRRRLAYKAAAKDRTLAPEVRARLVGRVKMLKWILVTAFGYQGYRNARFGRIECHEAINAYARALLADLVPAAEAAGYRVLHGIVDSLWLAPADPARLPDAEAFARNTSAATDLPLGYEGRYRWIVFLPAVAHGLGVPNRYYGCYVDGTFKLRGIGARRHDTPVLVRRFEAELLDAVRPARSPEEFRARLPRAVRRADRFAEQVAAGAWPVEELVIAHRLGQAGDAFVTFTDSVAAVRQLAAAGAPRAAGETVRFVVLDRGSRSYRDRVRPLELVDGSERYDADAYLDLLAREAETLFGPFGIRRDDLRERWGGTASPARGRYRSPETATQEILAAPPGPF